MSTNIAAMGGRLRLLVSLVVTAGLVCAGWAAFHLDWPVSPVQMIAVAGLIAVASGCTVPLRLGTQQAISVTGTTLLLAVLLLPPGWMLLCVAAGVMAGKIAIRRPPVKAAFTAAKDTVGAAAVVAVAYAVGLPAGPAEPGAWTTVAVVLPLAAAAYALVDELVGSAPMALATSVPWRKVAVRGLGLRTVGRLADVTMAAAVTALVWVDSRLLVAAPLAVLVVYLGYTRRIRLRQERQLLAELVNAADAVARAAVGGDLEALLRTAAGRAVDLFPAAARVELAAGDRTAAAGAPPDATAGRGPASKDVPLATELDHCPPAGTVRLWLREPAAWSQREQQLLTHFAATTATAVRSCHAYAAVAAEAAGNAHAAAHDPLTGLANRRKLHQHAQALLSRRPRDGYVSLMLIDLDNFKQVNDALGHAAGDQLLLVTAARLESLAGGGLVARIGGDEFAVLLGGLATPARANLAGQQLLKALSSEKALINDTWVELAATAGLALAGDDTTDPGELLHRADMAMYQAKGSRQALRLGVYARTRGRRGLGTPATAGTMARALASGQMQVRYQPIVDLRTGQVTAVEATAGWKHPELGTLSPSGLLAVAEQSGILAEMTDAVLDQALRAAATWRRRGFGLPVAVDVSPRNLADPRFTAAVLAKLTHAGLDPRALVVELNRSSTINDPSSTERGVRTLQQAGVAIAADEVGTPQVQLSTIASLRPDQLKIDVAAVGDLTAAAPLAMLCSMVALADSLGSSVVAVGVERESQRQTLSRNGCATGQGPMFGVALPETDLLQLLQCGYQGLPTTLAAPLPDAGGADQTASGHRLHGIRRGLSH